MDTSALVAIFKQESDAHRLAVALQDPTIAVSISAGSLLELGIVVDRSSTVAESTRLGDILAAVDITVLPVTERQVDIAREAYQKYGRGSGHRANLNFGDCFAYALAKDRGEPLLCKGDDFVHTDLTLVRY